MNRHAFRWQRHALGILALAAVMAACVDDTAVGPSELPTAPSHSAGPPAHVRHGMITAASPGSRMSALDLAACGAVQVPSGNRLALRVFASGVQIYRWNGTSWSFVAPSALLHADAAGSGIIGTHYAGPTWESASGGTLVGAVIERCTPDPDAIPWLLLEAVATAGPGIFDRVTFIQRINTVGGTAPAGAGSVIGDMAEVPYTTEYLFYRAE
jgi:hypothetical protein